LRIENGELKVENRKLKINYHQAVRADKREIIRLFPFDFTSSYRVKSNKMKSVKMFVLLALAALAFQRVEAQANAIDKYVEDERFTVVYISPKLFQLIDRLDVEGLDMEDKEAEAVLELAKDLRGLRILVAEEDSEVLYKEAKSKINTKEYEVLMTVRSKDGDNFEFLIKEEGEIINELLMLVGGDDFVLMSFVGKIDLAKVAKLARAVEGEDN
jgi:hypothetical protein